MTAVARSARRLGVFALGLVAVLLVVSGCQSAPASSTPDTGTDSGPTVEIIALNHPPLQSVIAEIDALLQPYADRVTIRKYDAEADDGKELADAKGLTGHVALVVLVNGEPEVTLGDRTVRFQGFPQGKAPMKAAEGQWTMEDLRAALDQELAAT